MNIKEDTYSNKTTITIRTIKCIQTNKYLFFYVYDLYRVKSKAANFWVLRLQSQTPPEEYKIPVQSHYRAFLTILSVYTKFRYISISTSCPTGSMNTLRPPVRNGDDKTPQSEIYIKMQSLPTSRFKRIVVRTTMDLVVSIGGIAGLFIGASILSIVETVYLIVLRKSE
ncbi:hypothetical protein NQ317_008813, partial [Molorchus minor]